MIDQALKFIDIFKKIEHYNDHSKIKEIDALKQKIIKIERLIKKSQSLGEGFISDNLSSEVEEILRHNKISDDLVQALRAIAVSYEENLVALEPNGEMSTILNSNEGANGNVRAYLTEMKNMSGDKVGGAPELFALEKVLGIGINIVDSDSSGVQGKIVNTPACDDRKSPGKIHILRRGYHYDLALPKQVV